MGEIISRTMAHFEPPYVTLERVHFRSAGTIANASVRERLYAKPII